MAKKEEAKEGKETKPEAHKKEAPKKDVKEAPKKDVKETPVEAKKEKKSEKKHEGEGKEHAKKERKGAPKEGKKEVPKSKDAGQQEEIRHIVRIADTDLDGKRSVHYALTGIKGISKRVARVLCDTAGLNPKATIGYLKDAEIENLQSSVDNVMTIIPHWMMNKQNDTMSGEDKHVVGTDVLLSLMEDLNIMKKMRSYKGVRHDRGLRVRGQRSRSTGRKGRVVGVSRAALAAGKEKAPAEGKKEEPKGAAK
jgi:small subunit ribosomal protein S13